MTPHQGSSRFQADFDQHGDIRTSRFLRPPRKLEPSIVPRTAYALVYQPKDKKDLAYCRLQDLEGFTERVCASNHDFPDLAFHPARPYDTAYQVTPRQISMETRSHTAGLSQTKTYRHKTRQSYASSHGN
ncbi:hypothetical protein N7455_002891 [Penicillium solitum]|uniref:uncharacterized protein n=1 Tax=Penicillium solitum TaxID=60172 RepID=UPI00178D8C58|nr:hypothetical protein HAV15_007137 [Penicillium sp. str. \